MGRAVKEEPKAEVRPSRMRSLRVGKCDADLHCMDWCVLFRTGVHHLELVSYMVNVKSLNQLLSVLPSVVCACE